MTERIFDDGMVFASTISERSFSVLVMVATMHVSAEGAVIQWRQLRRTCKSWLQPTNAVPGKFPQCILLVLRKKQLDCHRFALLGHQQTGKWCTKLPMHGYGCTLHIMSRSPRVWMALNQERLSRTKSGDTSGAKRLAQRHKHVSAPQPYYSDYCSSIALPATFAYAFARMRIELRSIDLVLSS
jgi:hypothetical protein